MPYLIDGLNFIHGVAPLADELNTGGPEAALRRLGSMLLRCWPGCSSRIEIVMDRTGGRYGCKTKTGGVVVHCSAHDEAADELILRKVEKHPGYFVVVTNDRRLGRAVSSRGTPVMTVEQFVDVLTKKHGRAEESTEASEGKPVPNENDTAYWMKLFSDS